MTDNSNMTPEAQDTLNALKMAYEETPDSAPAAASFIQGMRRAKIIDPFLVHDVAKPIYEKFKDNRSVVGHYKWTLYDIVKKHTEKANIRAASEMILTALQISPESETAKSIFIPQLAWAIRGLSWSLRDMPFADRQEEALNLLSVSRKLYPFLKRCIARLDTIPNKNSDEYEKLAQVRDIYFDSVRRIAKEAEAWEALRDLGWNVVTGKIVVSDPVQYGQALFAAIFEDIPEPDGMDTVIDDFMLMYGRNEYLMSAYARWLAKRGDADRARAAFRQAVALAESPWPWRDFGRFLIERNDAAEATTAFQASLSKVDVEELGSTWRVHFELAKLHLDMGENEAAGIEAHLAQAVRAETEWNANVELDAFIEEKSDVLGQHISAARGRRPREIIADRIETTYKPAWEDFLANAAVAGTVEDLVTVDNTRRALIKTKTGENAVLKLNADEQPPEKGGAVFIIEMPIKTGKDAEIVNDVLWWQEG